MPYRTAQVPSLEKKKPKADIMCRWFNAHDWKFLWRGPGFIEFHKERTVSLMDIVNDTARQCRKCGLVQEMSQVNMSMSDMASMITLFAEWKEENRYDVNCTQAR